MTIIEEKIFRNNGRSQIVRTARTPGPVEVVPDPVAPPVPTLTRVGRLVAMVVTAAIAVGSFALSFAGLAALAARSGIPGHLAWVWPAIVDGTIVQATVAVIVLAAYPGQARNRRFFWSVLIASASVSVGGNILHALVAGPVAAAVAAIAPLSLLATTHGLAILVRFNPEEENQ